MVYNLDNSSTVITESTSHDGVDGITNSSFVSDTDDDFYEDQYDYGEGVN